MKFRPTREARVLKISGGSSIPVSIFLILTSLQFVSCSTPERKSFSPTECNEQGGYERGYSEGKQGHDPDSGYAYSCREDLREPVRRGYRTGYEKGQVEFKEMRAQWNAQNNAQALQPLQVPQPQSTFFCKITWNQLGFESSASTLDEAREKVVHQCAQSIGRSFCAPLPQCRENRAEANSRAVYCSVEPFRRRYESFGATELETRSQVRKLCAEGEHNDFFCGDSKISCKLNR